MRKMTAGLVIMLALALLAAACGPATQEPAASPTEEIPEVTTLPEIQEPEPTEITEGTENEPVVLRVGVLEDVDCWNPFSCFAATYHTWLVYDRITDAGPVPGCDGIPSLANSWEVSEDGRTWTIHLDEGITFFDGTPLNAQTVVDWFEWVGTTSIKYWWPETTYMESAEALDELTLQYTTSEPILISPDQNWIWMYITPPDYWSQYDDETLWGVEYYPPIGSGPYMVTEHSPGDYIIWDANPDYHRGKPPIDRMVWQIYSNEDALVNALITGEIDLTMPRLSAQYYDVLSGSQNITISEKPGALLIELFFNVQSEGLRNPAINDPKVREAIDYAIDKQHLVDVALLGHGITCPTNWACGPLYEGELNPDLAVTPFDLGMANQILDDAGYLDTDGDGLRETSDGVPLDFRLFLRAENPEHLTIADALADWLGEIGIGVEVEIMESGTWVNVVRGERDFDMAISTMTSDPDAGGMDWYYSCWSAESRDSGSNYSGYCSEEFDSLDYGYWFAADSETGRESNYAAQAKLNQDRPFVILAGQSLIQAYNNEHFEFPADTCHLGYGMYGPQGLMKAVVK